MLKWPVYYYLLFFVSELWCLAGLRSNTALSQQAYLFYRVELFLTLIPSYLNQSGVKAEVMTKKKTVLNNPVQNLTLDFI